ncbi:hypothetical protein [Anaeroselena agilis]|uniref:Uncharacterized protein n=1 Tax=Anaeroselena agilis TaxID=3063788 RepID=A0ABU3NWG4_9FIRM|nr:hypothetical protein [Selenomonadales bacterium 4137-cl]
MTMTKEVKIIGVKTLKIAPITTNTEAAAMVYGTLVDVPGPKSISASRKVDTKTATGGGRTLGRYIKFTEYELKFENAKIPLDVLKAINGGTIASYTIPKQAESIEVTAGATDAGDTVYTVTAAGMTNSPKDVTVAVLATDDTEAEVAAKMRTAFAADADVGAFFDVAAGTSATVLLTAKTAAVNDPTMKIALKSAASTGVTAAASVHAATPREVHAYYETGDDILGAYFLLEYVPEKVDESGVADTHRTFFCVNGTLEVMEKESDYATCSFTGSAIAANGYVTINSVQVNHPITALFVNSVAVDIQVPA